MITVPTPAFSIVLRNGLVVAQRAKPRWPRWALYVFNLSGWVDKRATDSACAQALKKIRRKLADGVRRELRKKHVKARVSLDGEGWYSNGVVYPPAVNISVTNAYKVVRREIGVCRAWLGSWILDYQAEVEDRVERELRRKLGRNVIERVRRGLAAHGAEADVKLLAEPGSASLVGRK